MRQHALRGIRIALVAAVAFLAPARLLHAQAPAPGAAGELGTIAGHVSVPSSFEVSEPVRVVLMAPRWATLWNGDVQQRLDEYFNRYRDLVDQDRSLFERLSGMARRDAAASVLWQMQRAMGEDFAGVVREVSPEGRFEFTGIPFGEYEVLVLARDGERSLIWTETVDIHSPTPQFVEVRNRIQ